MDAGKLLLGITLIVEITMKLYELLERLEDVNPEAELLVCSTAYDDDAISNTYEISVYEPGDLVTETGEDLSFFIDDDGKATTHLVILS